MNLARSIILVVSIGAGLLAAYLAYFLVKPAPVSQTAQRIVTTEALVVIRNIQSGGVLQEADLRWVEWPQNSVTPGMIIRVAEPAAIKTLAGKVVLQTLTPGEPLRRDKILDTGGGGTIAAVLAPGKRAYAITIDEKMTAGGFVLPNDKVDILALKPVVAGVPGTKVVIRSAKVLAIGHRIDASGERVALARFATVEVTPEQLELLASLEREYPLLLTPLNLVEAQSSENGSDDKFFQPTISYFGKTL